MKHVPKPQVRELAWTMFWQLGRAQNVQLVEWAPESDDTIIVTMADGNRLAVNVTFIPKGAKVV